MPPKKRRKQGKGKGKQQQLGFKVVVPSRKQAKKELDIANFEEELRRKYAKGSSGGSSALYGSSSTVQLTPTKPKSEQIAGKPSRVDLKRKALSSAEKAHEEAQKQVQNV